MDKKLTIKRIVIFTLLAIVLSAVWGIIFLYLPDGPTMYDDPENATPMSQFAGWGMMGPAIAAFLTRLITKEGMSGSMLKFNIKGNVKYYILPYSALLCVSFINALFMPIVAGESFYFGNDMREFLLLILNTAVSCAMLCGLYFGEEYGWRGYLYPKLEELFGTGKALVLTGIIWGVWHTPWLLKGHNFGTDIPLFPVSNILLMCVLCVFVTPVFVFFSKKTNSVWPAVLAHGFVNNFVSYASLMFIDGEKTSLTAMQISSVFFIGYGVVGAFFFIVMVRQGRKIAG